MPTSKEDHAAYAVPERLRDGGSAQSIAVRGLLQRCCEEIAAWHRQMQAWSHIKSEALEELRLVRLSTPPRGRAGQPAITTDRRRVGTAAVTRPGTGPSMMPSPLVQQRRGAEFAAANSRYEVEG